jgi:hypothetical protein
MIKQHGFIMFFLSITWAIIPSCRMDMNSSDQTEICREVSVLADNAVGGGQGYQKSVQHGDITVGTLEEMLHALNDVKLGQVIYINDAAEIDMTGRIGVVIPENVTLASGRGMNGSRGALLFTTELGTNPLFVAGGTGVRLTGLRFRGPDTERREKQMAQLFKEGRYYSIPNSDGIQSVHQDLEVDNCELWGWSNAAVNLKKGALGAHIHHNYIHHNQRWGLGYGICLDESSALIEANLFDWNRHAIAGTGRRGTSYEARYNVILENANSYSFDMHGGADRKDGTDIAGDRINIHHNIFKAISVSAVIINGKPFVEAEIHHNWFYHETPASAVKQIQGVGNMHVFQNFYTKDKIMRD